MLELCKPSEGVQANVQLNEWSRVIQREGGFLPINGEKQALATPNEKEILSRVRIKLGRLRFSDQTCIRCCNLTFNKRFCSSNSSIVLRKRCRESSLRSSTRIQSNHFLFPLQISSYSVLLYYQFDPKLLRENHKNLILLLLHQSLLDHLYSIQSYLEEKYQISFDQNKQIFIIEFDRILHT